jgi:hypothetical protein
MNTLYKYCCTLNCTLIVHFQFFGCTNNVQIIIEKTLYHINYKCITIYFSEQINLAPGEAVKLGELVILMTSNIPFIVFGSKIYSIC